MHTVTIALLQLAASLLITVQKAPSNASPMLTEQVIAFASRAVQISTQELASSPPGYVPIPNNGIWPSALDLDRSLYLDSSGSYVSLGESMQAFDSYASFGDLNGDGVDDAVVVVKKTPADGVPSFALAFLLNQGGILFNIADAPLLNISDVESHAILDGQFSLGVKTNPGSKMLHYKLLGNEVVRF